MALPVLPNQWQAAMSIASITTPSFSKIRMTCFLRKLFGKQNFCNFNAFTMQVLFRSVHVSSIGMIFSFKFLWLMKRVVRSFFCNHNFTLKNFIFFFKIVDFFFLNVARPPSPPPPTIYVLFHIMTCLEENYKVGIRLENNCTYVSSIKTQTQTNK